MGFSLGCFMVAHLSCIFTDIIQRNTRWCQAPIQQIPKPIFGQQKRLWYLHQSLLRSSDLPTAVGKRHSVWADVKDANITQAAEPPRKTPASNKPTVAQT
jgi:hypothetical protein